MENQSVPSAETTISAGPLFAVSDRIFFYITAVVFFALAVSALYFALDCQFPPAVDGQSVRQGLFLAYGVMDPAISYALPLPGFLNRLALELPSVLERLPQLLFIFSVSCVLFGAGAALRSSYSGLLAVAGFAWMICRYSQGTGFWAGDFYDNAVFTFCCAMIAYALVLRASSCRRALLTEILLVLAIGVSYTCKSLLFLLPPVLAAYDLASGALRRRETTIGRLLLLTVGPYLMSLPWIYMNYRVFGEFSLFERGRALENIISGAFGIVFTTEGLDGLEKLNSLPPVWAAKTVFLNPLPYASALLKRLLMVYIWQPVLSILFIAICLRFRREAKMRLLSLFVAYGVGVQVLFSVESRYFVPLWPAALLAIAALFDPASYRAERQARSRPAMLLFMALLFPLLLLYGRLSAVLLRYSGLAKPPAAAAASIASENTVSGRMVLGLIAKDELRAGNIRQALSHASAALLAVPSAYNVKAYAYALLASGGNPAAIFKQKLLECRAPSTECFLVKAAAALKMKRYDEGLNFFLLALHANNFMTFTFRGITSEHEYALYRRLRSKAEGEKAREFLSSFADSFPEKTATEFKQALLSSIHPVVDDEQTARSVAIGELLCGMEQARGRVYAGDYPSGDVNPEVRGVFCRAAESLLGAAKPAPGTPYAALSRAGDRLYALQCAQRALLPGEVPSAARTVGDFLAYVLETRPASFSGIFDAVRPYLTGNETLLLMDRLLSAKKPREAVLLGRSYLRHADDQLVRLSLVSALVLCRMGQEAAEELSLLSVRKDAGLFPEIEKLRARILELPESKSRYAELRSLLSVGDYAALGKAAAKYASDYPFDKRALPPLAVAQLMEGRYDEAARSVAEAGRARLLPYLYMDFSIPERLARRDFRSLAEHLTRYSGLRTERSAADLLLLFYRESLSASLKDCAAIRNACSSGAEQRWALSALETLSGYGRVSEAIACAEKYLECCADFRLGLRLAELQLLRGNPQAASVILSLLKPRDTQQEGDMARFTALFESSPKVRARFEELAAAKSAGDSRSFLGLAERYHSDFPSDSRALPALALARLASGDLQGGRKTLSLAEEKGFKRQQLAQEIAKLLEMRSDASLLSFAKTYAAGPEYYFYWEGAAKKLASSGREKEAVSLLLWLKETDSHNSAQASGLLSRLVTLPSAAKRFKEIEVLHNTRQYAALIKPARAYLADYPQDKVATLFLAAALIDTGAFAEASTCLDRAGGMDLAPHERQWLSQLRLNLSEKRSKKR